jgi:endothelin-converting enzyme/putative endopeptidase
MTIAELQKVTPAINWKEYLLNWFTKLDSVIVSQPKYMKVFANPTENNVVV